jgi:hypothetical protein
LFDLEGIEFEEDEDPHQEPDNDLVNNDWFKKVDIDIYTSYSFHVWRVVLL